MKDKLKTLAAALWAKWKCLRAKLPFWPRRWKVIRNLAVAIALLAATPVVMDWPVFSKEAAFHRLEAQSLLSPSEVVMQVGNCYVTEGEDWITVGVVRSYRSDWKPFQSAFPEICYVVPKDETSVFLLPSLYGNDIIAVASGLPEEAQRGVLHIEIGEGPVEAVRDEHDILVFRIGGHALSWLELRGKLQNDAYTLELLDGEGNLLQQVEGRLPDYLTFLNGMMAD